MEDKDLDKLFRDAFIEAEEEPKARVWHTIADELEKQAKVVTITKRRNWWAYAAAAVFVLSVGSYFTISLFTTEEKNNSTNQNNIAAIAVKPEIETTPLQEYVHAAEPEITLPTKITPAIENVISKNNIAKQKTDIEIVKLNIGQVEGIAEPAISLSKVDIAKQTENLSLIRQVTEIDDIKPLIEFDEDTETMLAKTDTEGKKNVITSLLNTISENIGPKKTKDIRFIADEEGSFSISINNSIAKNPSKKRK